MIREGWDGDLFVGLNRFVWGQDDNTPLKISGPTSIIGANSKLTHSNLSQIMSVPVHVTFLKIFRWHTLMSGPGAIASDFVFYSPQSLKASP
jgi:hypothetical protein